jgi:hypothetical protein
MYAVVVKPFTAYGQDFGIGEMVDISDFPKGELLIRSRYLRHASVDEVQKATGMELPDAPTKAATKTKSSSSVTPAKAGKPKTVAPSAPPPSAPPLRQSRQARAKAARQ